MLTGEIDEAVHRGRGPPTASSLWSREVQRIRRRAGAGRARPEPVNRMSVWAKTTGKMNLSDSRRRR
jgi:hypothetical protein